MIFFAVRYYSDSNEQLLSGRIEESDLTAHDTDYIAKMNMDISDTPTDFTITFHQEIGSPITVSLSKINDSFHVLYQDTNYINFDWARLFIWETINRHMGLKKREVEIHGESLA